MLTDALQAIDDLKGFAREAMRKENLAYLARVAKEQDRLRASLTRAALGWVPEAARPFLTLPEGDLGELAWVAVEVPGHHAAECLFRLANGEYEFAEWTPDPNECRWVEGEPRADARWRVRRPGGDVFAAWTFGAAMVAAEWTDEEGARLGPAPF